MNKELINKYKPEFDHFLNEGKILYKHIHSIAWWNDEPWDYSPVYITAIIINDEYSEFRKALAEGKTIQIYDVVKQHVSDQSLDVYEWRDFKSFTASSSFSKTPDLYRIKPDESKFKVGDLILLDPRTIQPWTPVKGEWCWFYDSSDSRYSHLAQFYGTHKSSASSISTFMSSKKLTWYYCEPFLNSLPSYLKDK